MRERSRSLRSSSAILSDQYNWRALCHGKISHGHLSLAAAPPTLVILQRIRPFPEVDSRLTSPSVPESLAPGVEDARAANIREEAYVRKPGADPGTF